MTFRKNNKLGAKKFLKTKLDSQPICFKAREGQKEKLKTVPDWQERLRDFIDEMVKDG